MVCKAGISFLLLLFFFFFFLNDAGNELYSYSYDDAKLAVWRAKSRNCSSFRQRQISGTLTVLERNVDMRTKQGKRLARL